MDLPVAEQAEQKRPSLKADAISKLIQASSGQEQALYVLLAATGLRISEALAVEKRHFINGGRTITVEQQVEKDSARIVKYLKTAAAKRQIDLHPDIAEYLQRYGAGKTGLLFHTANGKPHLYGNLEDRWLTPRLVKMGLDEEGMGWHSFKRFRKTWLRGSRCLEDINNFWMAHKPQTCQRSTRIFTRNCDYASMKQNEWATDSLFRVLMLALLYRLSRIAPK